MSPNYKTNRDVTSYLVKILGDYHNKTGLTYSELVAIIVSFNTSMAATMAGALKGNEHIRSEAILENDDYKNFVIDIAHNLLNTIGTEPSSVETIMSNDARTQ